MDTFEKEQRKNKIATCVLVGVCLYSASFAFLALASRTRWDTPGNLVVSYLAPGLGIIFCLLALNHRHRRRWALVAFGMTLGLWLTEGVVMPNLDKIKAGITARTAARQGVNYDKRSRSEYLRDLQQDGVDAISQPIYSKDVPLYRESVFVPLSGFSARMTVAGNETGERMVYMADEHGFNNPEGLYENPEVVLVGDSFAQGCSVSVSETTTACMRRTIPRALSLGYAGHGPLMNLATIREYVEPLRPRTVFWLHFEGNDLIDLRRETRTSLVNYRNPEFSMDLLNRRKDIEQAMQGSPPAKSPNQVNLAGRLLNLVKLSRCRLMFGKWINEAFMPVRSVALGLELQPELVDIVCQAADTVRDNGGELVFVYLPDYRRYAIPEQWEEVDSRKELFAQLANRGVKRMDLCLSFESNSDPLSFFPFHGPGHYNEKGYALLADELTKIHLGGSKPE